MSIEKIGRGLPFFSVPCCTQPGFVIFTMVTHRRSPSRDAQAPAPAIR
jgi:hypothetical protein